MILNPLAFRTIDSIIYRHLAKKKNKEVTKIQESPKSKKITNQKQQHIIPVQKKKKKFSNSPIHRISSMILPPPLQLHSDHLVAPSPPLLLSQR